MQNSRLTCNKMYFLVFAAINELQIFKMLVSLPRYIWSLSIDLRTQRNFETTNKHKVRVLLIKSYQIYSLEILWTNSINWQEKGKTVSGWIIYFLMKSLNVKFYRCFCSSWSSKSSFWNLSSLFKRQFLAQK